MTKYTEEQVLAVLEPATEPMSTADVLRWCRENAGLQPYGPGSGKNTEVREALDALVAAGTVVSAKCIYSYRDKGANPYQFIAARSGRIGELMWMTKVRVDEYGERLAQRRRDYEASVELATAVRSALPNAEVTIYENGTFKIEGNVGNLREIARSLRVWRP